MLQRIANVSSGILAGTVATSTWLLVRMRTREWLPAPHEILDAPPENAIYGVIWLLALSLTGWIALTTLLSVVVYTARVPAAIRAVEWMTLPPIRRIGRRWAGLVLAMGSVTMAGAAGATVVPPIPLVGGADQPVAAAPHSTDVSPDSAQGVYVPAALTPAVASARHERALPGSRSVANAPPFLPRPITDLGSHGMMETGAYTVRSGDNLWSISATHVASGGSGAPSLARVVAVWRQVVALNHDRLRSGNPDLVFPGEVILLPPLSADSDG